MLITGASGQGKSTLALGLIAQGAKLVADDQVLLFAESDGRLIATRPTNLPPLIEARGVGLLHAPVARSAPVKWVVDMNEEEDQRLPPDRQITIMGLQRPLLYRGHPLHFPLSMAHLLRHGRYMP